MDLQTLGQLLNTTLVFSTALIFAALGGIFSERSGVVNIGLEGLMMFGAFAAAVGGYYAQDAGMGAWAPWVGVICAMAVGVIGSLIHAVAAITFKADQTISGTVINFLAAGSTLYIVKLLFDGAGETPLLDGFKKYRCQVFRRFRLLAKGFLIPIRQPIWRLCWLLSFTLCCLRLRLAFACAQLANIRVLQIRWVSM